MNVIHHGDKGEAREFWKSRNRSSFIQIDQILLEVIGNGFFQTERIVGRLWAAAYLFVAFRPFVTILLGYERITEVEEHPGHSDDAVNSADGLTDEQSDADSLKERDDKTKLTSSHFRIGNPPGWFGWKIPWIWVKYATCRWRLSREIGRDKRESREVECQRGKTRAWTGRWNCRRTRCSIKRNGTRWRVPT